MNADNPILREWGRLVACAALVAELACEHNRCRGLKARYHHSATSADAYGTLTGMRPRISAVINTLNEEKNLPFALQSVCTWVDEIVVVDMHSTDRTLEIAREFGARIFLHEPMGFAEPARAFALARATGDWILLLDADEVVPFSLSRRLLSIAANNESDAVLIPWLNYVFG